MQNHIVYSSDRPPSYLESGEYRNDTKQTVSQSARSIRMAFVRKVYAILSIQLALTAGLSAVMYLVEPVKIWTLDHYWMMWVAFGVALGTMIPLFFLKKRYPWNILLLFIFTISMAFLVGMVVITRDLDVILKSVVLTMTVFIGLTFFTIQSKWDFSGMGPFLFTGLILIIGISLVSVFFPYSSTLQLIISIASCVIFSGYIIFDTYMIFNRMSPEDYIVAAISLYLDIINLFTATTNVMSSD